MDTGVIFDINLDASPVGPKEMEADEIKSDGEEGHSRCEGILEALIILKHTLSQKQFKIDRLNRLRDVKTSISF